MTNINIIEIKAVLAVFGDLLENYIKAKLKSLKAFCPFIYCSLEHLQCCASDISHNYLRTVLFVVQVTSDINKNDCVHSKYIICYYTIQRNQDL